MGAGRSQRARVFLDRAVAVDPNSPEVHSRLGFLLSQTGELEAVVESFGSAFRLGMGNTDAHSGLARVYLQRVERIEIRRSGVEEIETRIMVESGYRKAREERYVVAVESYREALVLDPERIGLLCSIALVHSNLRDWAR